jgi:uncharacterized protein (DUF433 family)
MNANEIITFEEGKRGGQPCIRGMRITVSDILDYLGSGMTFDELIDDFPELTREDIVAAINFAAELARNVRPVQTIRSANVDLNALRLRERTEV